MQPRRPLIDFHSRVIPTYQTKPPYQTPEVAQELLRLSIDEVVARSILVVARHEALLLKGKQHRDAVEDDTVSMFPAQAHETRELLRTTHIRGSVSAGVWWSTKTGTVKVLDLLLIRVPDEHQRQGVFTRMLEQVEQVAHERGRTIRVDGAFPLYLQESLKKRGYQVSPQCPVTLYRRP